jgi:transcription elongation factor GreA-like protein
MIDHDLATASIFLQHSQKIYNEKLLLHKESSTILNAKLESLWSEIIHYDIHDAQERRKLADKLVTFTSIVFGNTYTHAFN